MKLLNTRGVGEQITHQVKRLKYLKSTNDKNKIRLYDELNSMFNGEWWPYRAMIEMDEDEGCEYCNRPVKSNWGIEYGFYVCLGCCCEVERENFEYSYKNK